MLVKRDSEAGGGPTVSVAASTASNPAPTSASVSNNTVSSANHNETLYLCNFRVSVDGDWLCLKEVDDQDSTASTASSGLSRHKRPPDSLAITPELDRLEKIYPTYPVGNPKGIYLFEE